MDCNILASLSLTLSQSLLKLTSIELMMPSHPLLSPSLSFNLSQHQGLLQWVGSSHQVAKVLELQLQHHPFNEYSGLISFRIDWFDLLAVQKILKRLLQHHSSKVSILHHSDFFMVQLSHPFCHIVISRKTVHGWYGGCAPQSPQGSWLLPDNYPVIISLHNEITSST